MAEQDLKITYLIEAQDKASKTVEKIDKDLGHLKKSMEEVDKVRAQSNKTVEQEIKVKRTLTERIRDLAEAFNESLALIKKFGQFLLDIDIVKFTLAMRALSFALKRMGFDTAARFIDALRININKLLIRFQVMLKPLFGLIKNYDDLKDILFKLSGLDKIIAKITSFTGSIIALGASFLALSGTKKGISLLLTGIDATIFKLGDLNKWLTATFAQSYPNSVNVAAKSISLLQTGFVNLESRVQKTNNAVKGSIDFFNKVKTSSTTLGKTIIKAASHTELLEKGLVGLSTRLGLFAALTSSLGTKLLSLDSTLAKVTGTMLLLATAALGYLATVIRSVIVSIGDFIYSVGTNLVEALQGAAKEFIYAENEAQVFQFTIDSLNRETKGLTGSFEEWNKISQEFSKNMRFNVTDTRKSISELLRVGNTLGLTKDQMQELLPVIGELARANHRDLFSSTLAVVEALAGQTVMLQNMGVALTQSALKESEHGKAIGKKFKTLSDHQKTQVRYNVLLEKTRVLEGLTAGTADTLKAALERQEVAVKRINAALGEGASIIESQFNVQVATAYELLNEMSNATLKVVGFLGALGGRILQVIGFMTKWLFAIVLLKGSITALNILLGEKTIQLFLANLAKSELITKRMAASMPKLAEVVRTGLLRMSYAGLSVNNIFQLMGASARAAFVAMLPVLAVAAKFLAIGALVAAGIKILYDVLVRVDEATGIFSGTWAKLVAWFNESGVIDKVSGYISDMAKKFKELYIVALDFIASGVLRAFFGIRASALAATDKIKELGDSFKGAGKKSLSYLKSLVGFGEAHAAVTDETKKALDATAKAANEGASFQDKWNQYYSISDKYVSDLEAQTQKQLEALRAGNKELEKGKGHLDEHINKHQQILNIINQLKKTPTFTLNLQFATGGIQQIYNNLEKQTLDLQEKLKDAALGEAEAKEYTDAIIKNLETIKGLKLPVEISGAVGLVGSMKQGAQSFLATLSKNAGQALTAVFGPVAGAVGELIAQVINVFGQAPKEFVKQIVDTIANIDDIFKNIVVNLVNLPNTIIKGVKEFIQGLPETIGQLIDGILEAFTAGDALVGLIDSLAEALPKVVDKLIERLPSILLLIIEMQTGMFAIKLLLKILQVLPKLINALIGQMPRIIDSLIKMLPEVIQQFIKQIPQITRAFIEALPAIALAFSDALISTLTGGLLGQGTTSKVLKPLDFLGIFEGGGIPAIIKNMPKAEAGLIAGNMQSGDRVPVRVNSREMILNLQQQKELFNMIKSGFSGQQKIYVEVPVKVGERELGRANREIALNGWA